MSAALIGSLLGLGTNAVALGINQGQRQGEERRILEQPSAVRRKQQELSRRLQGAASSTTGVNPLLAQRNAARAEADASLGFAHEAAAEEAQKRSLAAQMATQRANDLQRGLVGLGAGIAGGSQMLGGLMKPDAAGISKPESYSKPPGPGAFSEGVFGGTGAQGLAAPPSQGTPVAGMAAQLGAPQPRPMQQGTVTPAPAPVAAPQPAPQPQAPQMQGAQYGTPSAPLLAPQAAPQAPPAQAPTPMPPAAVPQLGAPRMQGDAYGSPSAPLGALDPDFLKRYLSSMRYG